MRDSATLPALLGTAAMAAAILMIVALVGQPYSPQNYIFHVHGLSAYVAAVVLFFDGCVVIRTRASGNALRQSSMALLHLLSLSLAGGILDVLTSKPFGLGLSWKFGGFLGNLPYESLRFIGYGPLRAALAIIIALTTIVLSLYQPLHYLVIQIGVRSTHRTENKYNVEKDASRPLLKTSVHATDTVLLKDTTRLPPAGRINKKKPHSNLADQPIPLDILPEPAKGVIEGHSMLHLNDETLGQIERKIIDIALSRVKIKLNRVVDSPPTVGVHLIRFTFDPDATNMVLVDRLFAIANDLGIGLGRSPVTIQISSHITIDIPLSDEERTFVPIKPLIRSVVSEENDAWQYLFGMDTFGAPYRLPVRTCLHMLVGGQTQSGKTMLLHTLIFGFIFRYPPSQVRLALYDHKMEEFTCYRNLPHLWCPVANTSEEFNQMLILLEEEFQRRKVQRTRDRYAEFPLIVVFMDEFRGLTTERLVTLISECRSLSMVFILATQYPRSDIISTPVKANLVTGVCFKTRDSQASRLVIGEAGGERLMGKGDCLIHSPLALDRIQGAFCTLEDLEALETYLDAHASNRAL